MREKTVKPSKYAQLPKWSNDTNIRTREALGGWRRNCSSPSPAVKKNGEPEPGGDEEFQLYLQVISDV